MNLKNFWQKGRKMRNLNKRIRNYSFNKYKKIDFQNR